jgi:hypothetical protein
LSKVYPQRPRDQDRHTDRGRLAGFLDVYDRLLIDADGDGQVELRDALFLADAVHVVAEGDRDCVVLLFARCVFRQSGLLPILHLVPKIGKSIAGLDVLRSQQFFQLHIQPPSII